jgi:Uma2 family endonuclease
MSTSPKPRAVAPPRRDRVPPLENGDRLTRAEFERRYAATPESLKAELIEGQVYVMAPVRFDVHGGPHGDFMSWIGFYRALTPGVLIADNSTVRLDPDNEPQPDGMLLVDPACGGRVKIDEDGFVAGGPEFAGEVAASSASYDLHKKLNVYRRNGVQEYVVWRTYDQEIDWFFQREGAYERLPLADGLYKSIVFPGLWLEPAALLAGDMGAVLRTVQQGCATPEHAAFVERLRTRRSGS